MRRAIVPLALALALAPALVPTATATTWTVNIQDSAFNPDARTIQVGDSVTWNYVDAASHNVDFTSSSIPDCATGSSGSTCSRVFNAAGTYAYKCGIHPSMTGTITVEGTPPPNQPPAPAFNALVSGLNVTVDAAPSSDPDGTITAYAWRWGDGATATGLSASHGYAATGSYNVTLNVTDNLGLSAELTKLVNVSSTPPPNQPPNATFRTFVSGLRVDFDASASRDPDGQITNVSWEFGDGVNGTGLRTQHRYADGGEYNVTLRVTDNAGATANLTRNLALVAPPNEPPIASFTVRTQRLHVSVEATNSSDDEAIASYEWEWGDGSEPGTGILAQHDYTGSGDRIISLTITDVRGLSSTVTRTITLVANAEPSASFDVRALGQTVRLDATRSIDSDGSLIAFEWDLGDANRASGRVIEHTYDRSGTFTIRLHVEDNEGARDTASQPVTLNGFTAVSEGLSVIVDARFIVGADDAEFAWAFGDGVAATGSRANHTYASPGARVITLTATSDDLIARMTRSVTLMPPPILTEPSLPPETTPPVVAEVEPPTQQNEAPWSAIAAIAAIAVGALVHPRRRR